MPIDRAKIRNKLLSVITQDAFGALKPHLVRVDLPRAHVLIETNVPARDVCFIESGLASVVATSSDGEHVEVGHVGHDGLAGHHVLLKTDRTPSRTFMQVEGHGLSISIDAMTEILENFPAASDILLRYVHCCETQLAQSSLANARYNVSERLARCLLMVHDRMDSDHLPLTHEFLALMIGVRRSGVTNELHVLEGMHVIRATRGNVEIRDRPRLRDLAGGSYGVPEREYRRLIGTPLSIYDDE